jgi:heme-degrading monooxygenase HmoA
MMTIVTHVTLREGEEPGWDDAMRARLDAASDRPGWVGAQLLIPLDSPNQRTIVGSWETRADWEAWHNDEAFVETRQQLEGLQVSSGESTWYEVLQESRRG